MDFISNDLNRIDMMWLYSTIVLYTTTQLNQSIDRSVPATMNTTMSTNNALLLATDTDHSMSVVTIAGILLITTVSILAIGLLSWFFNRYCCCCRQRSNPDDRDPEFYEDHRYSGDIEEALEERCEIFKDNETTSTVPSVVTVSRSDRRRREKQGRASQPSNARRFQRRNGNSGERRSARRGRRRSSFVASRSTTVSNTDNFFDHTTILASSCDGMSLPDEGSRVDVDANSNKNTVRRNHNKNASRSFLDPPGARLKGESSSYPDATIQLRNPINGKSQYYFQDGEIDLLVDFLVHTEDYVVYPRSKLTILLRTVPANTQEEVQELEHLRAIVADAASVREEALRVFITTTAGESSMDKNAEDLVQCAPTGGILVTFGSVWELPEDHPDFLKDLVE